jgi:quinoprotein glucose dehydrogenase
LEETPETTPDPRITPLADMHLRTLTLLALALITFAALPADPPPKPYQAKVEPASGEAGRAALAIRVPKGFRLDLWAAEPLLANPVVFSIDHKGRVYVAESFRVQQGVTDIRGHMDWLDEDLSSRTVEDRVALMRRRLGKRFAETAVHSERIRLVEDTTGRGTADRATVFAEGFNRPQDGIAAGVLARGDTVWYACIPDLWRLRDRKGTGKADERQVLHTGYGVHINFYGHDLHGLVMGPDGKLYFSIGDRGLNVKSGGKHHFYPDTGCVLRCNPDGSDLEVFATGLRNPQELAFDNHGNLFTCDNNSDSGDRARVVYVVEGGDSGWRIGYQFDGSQGSRGPWNAERLWHPPHEGQPAWIVPPVANLADGPSGLTYYPGVGLPPRYENHFFVADFRGAANMSGIRSFTCKPKGAGFELTDPHQFVWGVLATDVDFGPDSAMYISDWVHGWGLTGKGRIWKVSDPERAKDAVGAEVKKLLSEGMASRSVAKTVKLLEHVDRRVRLEAQFALAQRGKTSIEAFAGVLKTGKSRLAKLHALWGLGQLGRAERSALKAALPSLGDADAEVRAQAANVLGEGKVDAATQPLRKLLKDAEPRVRFFAAQALGNLGKAEAFDGLIAMARENADRDPYLRHAAVQGLAGIADAKLLQAASGDASPAVRRAVLLAQRRLGSPDVARFLDDADPSLLAEAARAIHDVPIDAAMPRLAALCARRGLSEPVGYRVLNARFRSGKAEDARAVARFAARGGEREPLRVEAVRLLGMWARPPVRDRVMGVARPLPAAGRAGAAEAMRADLDGIFAGPPKLRREASRVVARLGVKEAGPKLLDLVADARNPADVRVETLRALASLKDERLHKAVALALADREPGVRAEARRVLAGVDPAAALPVLEEALAKGTAWERQQAFAVLGAMKSDKSDSVLAKWLDHLVAGKVAPDSRLDLVEAAEKRGSPALKQKLGQYEAARPKDEPFGRYRDSLEGGDAEAGKRIFLHKAELSCLRCHKANGDGTGEVGPDLTGIGSKQNREYLLESIVHPNKQIAKGYETVDVVLVTGKIRSGVLKSESAKELRLMTAEGELIVIPTGQIEERRSGKSAMPDDLVKHLSRKEMRDLVEFLASLKEAPKK